MAHEDGSIVIDTKIKSDGAVSDINEIIKVMKQMASTLNSIKNQMKSYVDAVGGSIEKTSKQTSEFNKQLHETEKEVDKLNGKEVEIEIHREQDPESTYDGPLEEPKEINWDNVGYDKEAMEFIENYGKASEIANEWKEELEDVKKTLSDLEAKGFWFGDKEYDDAFSKMQQLNNLVSDYKKELVSTGEISNPFGLNTISGKAVEAELELKRLAASGKGLGDTDYDDAFKNWQRLTQEVKRYKSELVSLSKINPFDTSTIEGKLKEAQNELEILKSSGKGLGDSDYDFQLQKVAQLKEEYKAYQSEISKTPADHAKEEAKIDALNQKLEETRAKEVQAALESKRLEAIAESAEVGDQRIVDLNRELAELKARQEELKSAGIGSGYKEFDENTSRIAEINSELSKYQKELTAVDEGQKKVADSSEKMSKSSGKTHRSFGKMIGRMLVMSVALRAFLTVTSGIKDGFNNLSQYSSETNNSLSMLWGSLVRLQNSLATAFAPILNTVAPILSKFIDMLSTAASYVSMFFSYLSGKKTYTKAIAVQKNYAKSLDKTSSSAKKNADSTKDVSDATEDATDATEDYLSPLDDLNKYTEESDKNNSSKTPSSGTDTGSGDGTGPMFEEVAISNDFSNLMDDILDKLKQIRDIFMAGFWKGLGDYKPMLEELQKDLTSIGEHLKDIFTDKDVQAAAQRFAKSFIYNLGKVVGSFASIGLTIAVNIVGGIESYLSENVNRIKKWLIKMFDIWSDINDIIGNLSEAVAYIFQQTFGTQTAQDLTGDILGIFMTAFGEVVLLASEFGKDILDALTKPIIDNKDDWIKAINDTLEPIEEVAQSIETFLQNVADKLTKLYEEHVGPFVQDIGDGLSQICDTILTTYDEYIAPVLDKWAEKFDEVLNGPVGDAITQLLDVLGQLIDLLDALWNNVLVPLIDWIIKNIVPILTPIVEWLGSSAIGLLGTVAQVVAGILKTLGGLITFLTGVFTGDWGKAFDGLKQMATGLRDALNGIFNFIRDSILKPISKFVNGIFKTDWTKAFGIIGDYMNGWAQNIKNLMDSVKQIFNGIVNFVNGVLSGNWRRAWEGIKQIFAGIWNAMASVVKSPINMIISFMNAMLRAAQKMQNGFASALNHMNISLPGWLQDLTGWSSVGFNIGYWSPSYIPYLAKGAVIPPNKEFMAVLGDQKNGNNIEAPENLIRQIVREESGGGQKQRIEIPVYLKGKQIYKAVVEEGKVVMSQTGVNPFDMA